MKVFDERVGKAAHWLQVNINLATTIISIGSLALGNSTALLRSRAQESEVCGCGSAIIEKYDINVPQAQQSEKITEDTRHTDRVNENSYQKCAERDEKRKFKERIFNYSNSSSELGKNSYIVLSLSDFHFAPRENRQ